ncbi:MAG: CHASE4 domain-containing protein, partial [Desulfohalobiaceae bacterium]
MSVRKTTILIVALMFACLIGLSYLTSRVVILSGFERIETDIAHQNARRALNALHNELDRIDTLLIDWAFWDDTVQFVQDGNEEYEASNLVDIIFIEQSLDLIAFFTPDGTLFWGSSYDRDLESMIPIPAPLAKALPPGAAVVTQASPESFTK